MVREMARGIPTPCRGDRRRADPPRGRHRPQGVGSAARRGVTGRAVHSSRIDQGVSAVMTAARLIAWLDDVMEENRGGRTRTIRSSRPTRRSIAAWSKAARAANIVASSAWFYHATSAPSRRKSPWDYLDALPRLRRERSRPRMKAIAPETGIEIELVSAVPGLRPERTGRPSALMRATDRRQRQPCRVLRDGGGPLPEAGWSTVVCGPGRHRAGASARRIYRGERVARPASVAAPPDRASCARDGRFGLKVGTRPRACSASNVLRAGGTVARRGCPPDDKNASRLTRSFQWRTTVHVDPDTNSLRRRRRHPAGEHGLPAMPPSRCAMPTRAISSRSIPTRSTRPPPTPISATSTRA